MVLKVAPHHTATETQSSDASEIDFCLAFALKLGERIVVPKSGSHIHNPPHLDPRNRIYVCETNKI